MYGGRTHFRPATWQFVPLGVASPVVFGVTVIAYIENGTGWMFFAMFAFSVLCLAGFLELFSSSIVLTADALTVRKMFRVTTLRRDEILSVSGEKGCPTMLLTQDGRKIELPDLGVRGIENSLRAWLRAS